MLDELKDRYFRFRKSVHVDIAVTGLSRAGKTVFITSAIHNLLHAGREAFALPHGDFDGLTVLKENRLVVTKQLPPRSRQTRAQFEFAQYLKTLTDPTSASWPQRTGAVSEIALGIKFTGESRGQVKGREATATVTTRFVDYPGEWLLDLPLLEHDFSEWSRSVFDQCELGSRKELSRAWRQMLTERDLRRPDEQGEWSRKVAEAYRDFLLSCRDRGLRFLQPARFVRPEGVDSESAVPPLDWPIFWFCPLPLPHPETWPADSIGAKMCERYGEYQTGIVRKFVTDTFGRFGRQLVLVDVLGALTSGQEGFDDTCTALTAVCRYLREDRSAFWKRVGDFARLNFRSPIEKVLFAATKADHVPMVYRPNLMLLLSKMLREPWRDAAFATTDSVKIDYLASVAVTEECTIDQDGRKEAVVAGILRGHEGRQKVRVAPIPLEVPDGDLWRQYEGYSFPEFLPPRFSLQRAIPHIRLDGALEFLLGDRLK